MEALFSLTKEAKESLSTIESTIQEVRANSKTAKTAVSMEFTELRKNLEKREHVLVSAIEAKEIEKVSELEQQCRVLNKALTDLSQKPGNLPFWTCYGTNSLQKPQIAYPSSEL
eukprot:TRINITY_DN77_c0_g1_i9.p1 TRINITY_DN77_c0_g1~~TRINITY_DN77_c0_g1_i9.p1  ORF type:complete len:114 (-),score=16.81 TRINITY_DN77_c0_g1_i9:94-435(-)